MEYIVTYELDTTEDVWDTVWNTEQRKFDSFDDAFVFITNNLFKTNIRKIQVFSEISLDNFLKKQF